MARPDHINHIEIMVADQQAEVRPDQYQAGTSAPVAYSFLAKGFTSHKNLGLDDFPHTQETWLDMLQSQI
jgi:hypothetical protein